MGVIPSGQENHSRAEHLHFPGRELNVIHFTEQYFLSRKNQILQIVLTVDENLCLEEKIQIMTYKLPEKLLNKRCELIARCRHKTKFKL